VGLRPPKNGQRTLDLPPETEKQPSQHSKLKALRPVVYTRQLAAAGVIWYQYWFWYLYNPGPPALHGVGRHEGDWEMVQIGQVGARPLFVTCSQHNTGGKREWWACEIREGRVVVYVALGSHANYFTPGTTRDLDVCDGRGTQLIEPEVRQFGSWASWRGRWGNSDNSPGPLVSRRAWNSPHLVHSAAR
jgi:hypothetical protein